MNTQSRLVKFTVLLGVAAFAFFLTVPAHAYKPNPNRKFGPGKSDLSLPVNAYREDPQRKFGRGLANTTFGMTELPREVHHVNIDEGPAAAVTYGVVRGLTSGIMRTLTGVFEIVTFPIPNSKEKGFDPLIEPEFPLWNFNEF